MWSKIFYQFARGKIAGHPIHSMLVHFPSALFPISLLFDLLSFWLPDHCLPAASFYCLGVGLIIGIIAACFGALDYSRLSANHPAWNKASLHGLLNVIWITLFAIVFALKLKHYPMIQLPTTTQIVISITGVIGLIYSNYLGGDLIFRHKIGIDD